jgi:hypothetical protein
MAQPQTVTVVGTVTRPGGSPESGIVKFEQLVYLRSGGDDTVIAPGERVTALASDGTFSLVVYKTTDAGWSPQGWSYRVTLGLSSSELTYNVLIPANAPAEVQLADLLPALTAQAGAMYSPIGHTHAGGGGEGDPAGTAAALVQAHVQAADPHPVYLSAAEGDDRYDAAGSTAAALSAHTGATDPHAQYLTQTEGDGRYAALGGGGAVAPTFVRPYVSTGSILLPEDLVWAPVAGLTVSIAAAVGDDIEVSAELLIDSRLTDFLDLAVIVGGTIRRAASSGTSTPAVEGDPAMYPDNDVQFRGSATSWGFTATADDISGGTVTIAMIHKGAGGASVLATVAFPFRWRVRNDH